MDTGNALPVMFNNMDEVKFLLSHLKVTDSVLEWGSGGSTLELAKHVNRVVSIEHDKNWFDNSEYQNLKNWLDFFLKSPIFLNVMEEYKPWKTGDEKIIF